MKSTNQMSLRMLKLKNSLAFNGSWSPIKTSKKKGFMKNVTSWNQNLINLAKIRFMEKIKEVVFLSMVCLFISTKLGKSLEAKKNLIYLIREKWSLNIDVTKSKGKLFNKLNKKFNNSRLLPKMGQFLILRINVKKSSKMPSPFSIQMPVNIN